MNILQEITAHKKGVIDNRKKLVPVSRLESSEWFNRTPYSFKNAINNANNRAIIAEFKRKSPSKGIINDISLVEEVTCGYADAGAACLSVLTDQKYFHGKNADLMVARVFNNIPILRKDFIVSEYQVIEAKAIGADAILLIANCLTKKETLVFADLARSLGLGVLLEVHNEQELDTINEFVDVVGVNNRNLETFEVSLETSVLLSEKIPSEFVKISESGISNIKAIEDLAKFGYQGFLIGENFMREDYPGEACKAFISNLNKLQ
ncbi:MAG: indole-3-glycerol phosphate synthase TrpC [Bacteroidales bacterium]|nr:indole-3-glycerol phosphate synthase TrpC [Bacteroidales bacterium]